MTVFRILNNYSTLNIVYPLDYRLGRLVPGILE